MADNELPSPDKFARARLITNPTTVAYTGTHGRTAALSPGMYWVSATTDCYFLQGGSGVTATSSSHRLAAGTGLFLYVSGNSDNYFSFIQVSSGGTGQCSRFE